MRKDGNETPAVRPECATWVKKIRVAVDNKDRETAEQTLQEAVPRIFRAASKGVIHKRTASRQVSRLMKSINALQENPQ